LYLARNLTAFSTQAERMFALLKISTAHADPRSIVLKLEGKLSGGWVELLRETCAHHRQRDDRALVLDVSAVSYASSDGVSLLIQLLEKGITCDAWPPFLRELCKEES